MNDNLENFAETTGVAGVLYAYQGARCERLFWIILVLLAVALTARDLTYLVLQYNAEETVTDMVLNTNTTITLPDPTMCLRIQKDQMRKVMNATYVNLSDVTAVQAYLTNFDNVDIVDYLLVHANDPTMYDEHVVLLTLSALVFYSVTHAEKMLTSPYGKTNGISFMDRAATWEHFADVPNFPPSAALALAQSVLLMRNYLLQRGVDFHKLRETLALAYLAQFTLKFAAPTTNTNFVNVQDLKNITVTWFGTEPFGLGTAFCICVRIPNSASFFSFDTQKPFLLQYSSSVRFDRTFPSISLAEFNIVFSSDPVGSQDTWTNKAATWSFAQFANLNYMVTYEQEHTAANLDRNPCVTANTNFDCKLACHATHIKSHCGCTPLGTTWNYNATDAKWPMCGLEIVNQNISDTAIASFGSCKADMLKDYDQLENCTKACLKNCQTISMSFRIADWQDNDYLYYGGITPYQFQYTVLTERLSMSSTDFVANLGGILGVWTGASLLAYVHVIIWMVKRLRTCACTQPWTTRNRRAAVDYEKAGGSVLPPPISHLHVTNLSMSPRLDTYFSHGHLLPPVDNLH